MKQTIIFVVAMLLFFAAGSSVFYLYGYKDSFWVEMISYGLIIFGWLCLLFLLLGLHFKIRGKDFRTAGAGRKIANVLMVIIYPAWLVALVAGFVWLGYLKDDRIEKVLATTEAHDTIASVIALEERRIKSSTHTYAIIRYQTSSGRIQQAIKDDYGMYRPGQEMRIRYSEKYPDMFKVLPPSLKP